MMAHAAELVKQAHLYASVKVAEVGGAYFDHYNEKFVELLVRECNTNDEKCDFIITTAWHFARRDC